MPTQNLPIVHVITGLSRGGAENVLYHVIRAQPDPSLHSVISLVDEGIFGERLQALGVKVRCMRLRRGRVPTPIAVWRLSRWIKQMQPAVVQTWMYHADLLGGMAARLAGIPVCWGLHHSNLQPDQNRRSTLRVIRINALLSGWLPSRIVSCSARAARIHHERGYADRFVVIPNGVDLARFVPVNERRRDSIRQALGFSKDSKVIGHLGRSDPQKDHLTLLKVFKQISAQRDDAYLLLAGMDLEHGSPYLDKLLDQAGIPFTSRIKALGQRDDVPDLMAAMDVFLLSSVGEAFPNVIVEAMACGTPCIVTDVGDSAEIVSDTGWIAPPGNVEQITTAILEALEEPKEARAWRGRHSRQRVESNFGVERMVEAYRCVWAEIAAPMYSRMEKS